MGGIYRFLVRGHLDDRWSEWLGGLSIQRTENGRSILTGSIPDQSALHGVIARIRDLGLPLLAMESASGCEELRGIAQTGARGSPGQPGDTTEDPTLPVDISQHSTTTQGETQCD